MKKHLLALIMISGLLFSLSARAQVVLNEDFSGSWPPAGWTISSNTANWSAVASANAGGEAPELRLNWSPQFNGETRLISPVIDLSANETGQLLVSFRQMLDHYGGAASIGIDVRHGGGNWQPAWQQTVSGNIAAQLKEVELSGAITSAHDFQLSVRFSGSSYNINYWYLDDIKVVAPAQFDLGINRLDIPNVFSGEIPVAGQLINLGLEPITSFDLNWQLDEEAIHTTSYSGLELGFAESFAFEAGQMLSASPGEHQIRVFLSNINGQSSDDNSDNDEMLRSLFVAHQEVARRPLFESFTSSTCPPCATFNHGFFNNFTQQQADNISVIKYQMSWPGAGDPYYTAEGGVRRTYYGVNSVPMLMFEGNPIATSAAAINTALQASLQKPAFVDIQAQYQVEGNMIHVQGSVMPYAHFAGVRIHVVVIEGSTTGNAASNGETIFYSVMHKMLPNAQGTSIDLVAMEEASFSFSHNMSTTNVEEMDDLKVVVFAQIHGNKEILQSAYASGEFLASPLEITLNIEDGAEDVPVAFTPEISFNHSPRHEDGSPLSASSLHEVLIFRTEGPEGEAVAFTASLNNDHTQITIETEHDLDYETQYYLELLPLMGEDDQLSEAISVVFTTEIDPTTGTSQPGELLSRVYPNPAASHLMISVPDTGNKLSLRLYDLSGALVLDKAVSPGQQRIETSSLPGGSYLLHLVGKGISERHHIQIIR